jgi:hypothetical protein
MRASFSSGLRGNIGTSSLANQFSPDSVSVERNIFNSSLRRPFPSRSFYNFLTASPCSLVLWLINNFNGKLLVVFSSFEFSIFPPKLLKKPYIFKAQATP